MNERPETVQELLETFLGRRLEWWEEDLLRVAERGRAQQRKRMMRKFHEASGTRRDSVTWVIDELPEDERTIIARRWQQLICRERP